MVVARPREAWDSVGAARGRRCGFWAEAAKTPDRLGERGQGAGRIELSVFSLTPRRRGALRSEYGRQGREAAAARREGGGDGAARGNGAAYWRNTSAWARASSRSRSLASLPCRGTGDDGVEAFVLRSRAKG